MPVLCPVQHEYYERYCDLLGGTDPGSDWSRATDYLVLSNGGVGFGGREFS